MYIQIRSIILRLYLNFYYCTSKFLIELIVILFVVYVILSNAEVRVHCSLVCSYLSLSCRTDPLQNMYSWSLSCKANLSFVL